MWLTEALINWRSSVGGLNTKVDDQDFLTFPTRYWLCWEWMGFEFKGLSAWPIMLLPYQPREVCGCWGGWEEIVSFGCLDGEVKTYARHFLRKYKDRGRWRSTHDTGLKLSSVSSFLPSWPVWTLWACDLWEAVHTKKEKKTVPVRVLDPKSTVTTSPSSGLS